MKNSLYLNEYNSPIGSLYMLSSKKGLICLAFSMKEIKDLLKKRFSGFEILKDSAVNKKVIKYLDAYFNGKKISLEIPLFLNGTEFQQKVWLELKEIPYGEVISYKELAERVGLKKGFQAVGQANSKNPFPIILPCHRVVTSDGKLGGYAGGLNKKKALLKLEGVEL